MALAVNDLIEIVLDQRFLGQQTINVWQYRIGNFPGSVSAVQLAEAWWNHVKATYRGLCPSSISDAFISVRLRELNDPSGDYAEFDIPVSERAGLRATSTEVMPPFASAGVRLVVGSRVTRPGQKRFAYLVEADNINGVLQTSYRTPLTSLMNVMVADMTLGAPAALTELNPRVVRKDANGFVVASQAITGYLINPNVTTQNTRKIGRGS